MNADISCQHTCVSEGVFASVSGCEETQHGPSSYHIGCSTCPSIPQENRRPEFERIRACKGTTLRSFAFLWPSNPSLHSSCGQQWPRLLLWPYPAVPAPPPPPPPGHLLDLLAEGMCQEGYFQSGSCMAQQPVPLEMPSLWFCRHEGLCGVSRERGAAGTLSPSALTHCLSGHQ